MSFPLVSVIIPVYNHAQYIVECLESIAVQDYNNIEVLLCDDGSSDNSFEVASEWIKNNTQIKASIVKQKNQGVCKTLNKLIDQANGKYIAPCASDDFLTVHSISERVEVLENTPDKLAVIGDAIVVDQDSNEVAPSAMISLYKAHYQRLLNDIAKELVFRWSVVGPTLLIRKDAYSQIGKYDESLLVEDREFYLRLLKSDSLIFHPATVAGYRIHTDNASRRSLEARFTILEQVAMSNVKHSKDFEGLQNFFLNTHFVDLFLLKLSKGKITFIILFLFRVFRYCAFTVLNKV